MTKQDKDKVLTFRWLLVDNQEMSENMAIVKLIDGYHVSKEEAQSACSEYGFEDPCFRVYKLNETAVLKKIIDFK